MKNSLKIALRGYVRNRSFTGLNLLSLVIGLFVAYTAIGYIRFELSYDAFHENADSIYRLVRTYRSQDYSLIGFANWNDAAADGQRRQLEALKTATGIVDAAQFVTSTTPTFVEANGRKIQETNLLTTNTPRAFCSIFSWDLKQGSFTNFADGTNTVILTESTARKLFGEEAATDPNLIQKSVKVGADTYTIAAIIADVPANSHVDFTMALSTTRLAYWGSRVYVQLDKGISGAAVAGKLNTAIAAFDPKLSRDPLYKNHFLQPITSLHLSSNCLYELKPPGNKLYIVIIGCFALFILIITLFNYANLSLAISSKQSKSIGVRKALGAVDAGIAGQFVVEGVLLALLALPIVAVVSALLIPGFNTLMGVAIPANLFADPVTFLLIVLLAVGIGLLSSSFTATALAWKKALVLFKENLNSNRYQHFPVRKYLVVSQFAILIAITSISWFVGRQLNFVDQKDLGFQKEGILYAYSSAEKQDVFQAKLRQIPGIKSAGNGSSFGIMPFNKGTYKLQESAEVFDDASQLYLDPIALKAYGLRTTLGTSIGKIPGTFTLINRTAAEKLARKQNVPVESIIGRTIVTEPEYVDQNNRAGFPFTVAGIFEDIHVFSLHEKVEPYFITVSNKLRMDGRTIVQYDPATTAQTVAQIRAVHASLNEAVPLEIEYLNEQVARLYEQDSRTANLLFYINLIAVVLAGLGIVGISIFLTVARTKEIGIRKVLGASSLSIIRSATKEYVLLVGIALLIGWPVAAYVVTKWLANFAYRIDIQQVAFPVIGLGMFALTALLVGIIAYRAAQANPVESLRSE